MQVVSYRGNAPPMGALVCRETDDLVSQRSKLSTREHTAQEKTQHKRRPSTREDPVQENTQHKRTPSSKGTDCAKGSDSTKEYPENLSIRHFRIRGPQPNTLIRDLNKPIHWSTSSVSYNAAPIPYASMCL